MAKYVDDIIWAYADSVLPCINEGSKSNLATLSESNSVEWLPREQAGHGDPGLAEDQTH